MATLATGQNRLTDFDRRRQLAAALTQQAINTNPIVHPMQGWAKLAQALVANRLQKGANRDETAYEKEKAAAIISALNPVHPTRIESTPTTFQVPGRPDLEKWSEIEQQVGPALDEGAAAIKQQMLDAARAPATNIQLEEISDSPKTTTEMLQGLVKADPDRGMDIAAQVTLTKLLAEEGLVPGLKADTTDDITEYSFARNQGYPGTLQEWLDRDKGLGTDGAPSGYKWNKYGGLDFIPGGPADPQVIARNSLNTPEQAAKVQLLKGASAALTDFKAGLFKMDENGNITGVSRTNIIHMNAPKGGTPYTQGRTLNVLLLDSIEAKLRAESGAAVPQTEVIRAGERFRPSVLDSDETVKMKIQLLNNFINGAYNMANKNGKFDVTATVDNAIAEADKTLSTIQNNSNKKYEVGDVYLDANGNSVTLYQNPDGSYVWQ